ncbi:MAG: hypothetical protein H6977_07030 [Gammaproteobacteria bacterium]|nr:hypothetical protein [Gammaproteobacteria bacterium]
MKIKVAAHCLLAVLLSEGSSNANAAIVRYTYESPPLIALDDQPNPTGFIFGAFDGTQTISGYIDFAGPLGPDLDYFRNSIYTPTGEGPDVVGFEFTDGTHVLGTNDGSAKEWSLSLHTDATGKLTGFYGFDVLNPGISQAPFTGTNQLGPASQFLQMRLFGEIDTFALDSVFLFECVELSESGFCTLAGGDSANSGNTLETFGIGAWATTPVPIPAPMILLGSALAGLALLRKEQAIA